MKRIGVVGTFLRDLITSQNGSEAESIGGLFHTLSYTALLARDPWQVVPVARIGRDYYHTLYSAVQGLDNVDLLQLQLDARENTKVKLICRTPTSREEVTTDPMPALEIAEVEGLTGAEGILINMITGQDISLKAIRWLREFTDALLYLDYHSLTLGIDASGKRYPRRPANWLDWLHAVDIAQMNEQEAACLSSDSEVAVDLSRTEEFVYTVLQTTGLLGLHVTLGERGALSGKKNADNVITIEHVATNTDGIEVKDTIGCGDAFGAAFLVRYLQDLDFFAATEFASKVATLNTTFAGPVTKDQYEKVIRPAVSKNSIDASRLP